MAAKKLQFIPIIALVIPTQHVADMMQGYCVDNIVEPGGINQPGYLVIDQSDISHVISTDERLSHDDLEVNFTTTKPRDAKIFEISQIEEFLDQINDVDPEILTLKFDQYQCTAFKSGAVTVGCMKFTKNEAEDLVKLVRGWRAKIKVPTQKAIDDGESDDEPYVFRDDISFDNGDDGRDVSMYHWENKLIVDFAGDVIPYNDLIKIDEWRNKYASKKG